MISLKPTALTDQYPTVNYGAILGPSGNGLGLDLTISNQPAFVRLLSLSDPMLGVGGGIKLTEEFYLPPTTKSWERAVGFAARNAVAGSNAIAAANVWERGDPSPLGGIQFSGTLTVAGAFTPSQTGFVLLSNTEFTAPVSITATTEATANTIVTAPSASFTGAQVIYVEFFSPAVSLPVGDFNCIFALFQDGLSIGRFGQVEAESTGIASITPVFLRFPYTPPSGAHIFDVRAFVNAGTVTIQAGIGGTGVFLPGALQISTVT